MSDALAAGGEQYLPNAIQEVQLRIISAIDALCAQHNLSYSLAGSLAIDFVNNGAQLSASYFNFELVMSPKHLDKFLDVAAEALPPHLGIESRRNNDYFDSSSVWVFDRRTIFYDPLYPRFQSGSIKVVITPLMPWRHGERVPLWEGSRLDRSITLVKNFASRKPRWVRMLLGTISKFQQRKYHLDWQNTVAHCNEEEAELLFALPKYRFRVLIVHFDRDSTLQGDLNGTPVMIHRALVEGPQSIQSRIPTAHPDATGTKNIVTSTSVGFEDFRDRLPFRLVEDLHRSHFKQQKLFARISRNDRNYYSAPNFALRISFKVHESKWRDRAIRQSAELSQAMTKQDFDTIKVLLDDYPDIFEYYLKQNLMLVVDQQMLDAMILLWRHEGENAKVEALWRKR